MIKVTLGFWLRVTSNNLDAGGQCLLSDGHDLYSEEISFLVIINSCFIAIQISIRILRIIVLSNQRGNNSKSQRHTIITNTIVLQPVRLFFVGSSLPLIVYTKANTESLKRLPTKNAAFLKANYS